MAFVAVPNVVMCELVGTKDGQRIENRFHVDVGHEPTPADLTALINILGTWENTDYKDILPVDVHLVAIDVTSLHVQNGPVATSSFDLPGGIESASLPNECTFCVTLKTASRGRSARGRMYMLGLAENQRLGQNRVTTAYRLDAEVAVRNLIGVIEDAGFHMCVVSYVSNGVPRVGGPVKFNVVDSTSFDDVIDSMKRRKPGIGT